MTDDFDDGESAFAVFDEEEYSPGPARVPRPTPRAPQPEPEWEAEEEFQEEPAPVRSMKSGNSEVRRRLALAGYYSEMESIVLFDGDDSDEAEQIRRDLRGWIERQQERLIGVGGEEPGAGAAFTPEEVVVLKALAARASLPQKSQEPARAPAPPSPRPAPAIRRAQPAPQPPAAPPAKRPAKKAMPKVGQVFEENGRYFKYVPNPDDPEKVVKLDVTRQMGVPTRPSPPPTAAPMPTGAALEMATASLADRTVRESTKGNPAMQKRIVAALNTPAS